MMPRCFQAIACVLIASSIRVLGHRNDDEGKIEVEDTSPFDPPSPDELLKKIEILEEFENIF